MKQSILSSNIQAEIDAWVKQYPANRQQSALLPALLIVQKANAGYLSDDLIEAVAAYLNIPAIEAYEVVTFYSMYERKPVGKYKICVCTNVSCMLRGSEEIVSHLKKKLGIDWNETTPDGKFSLKEVECMAACVGAPMMAIEDVYYENLSCEEVDRILDEYS